jgi:curved DNA-binding protein
MQFKDYYDTLGVEPNAGEAEIKSAYRRLARKFHPDVSKEPGAEEKFKAVNEAYEALRDPEKRKAYDQLRTRGYRPGDEVQPPGGFGGGSGDFDFEEVFAGGGAGGGFSDFFESLFRRAHEQQAGPGPGPYARHAGQVPPRDTRAKLAVSLYTVHRGENVRVTVNNRTLDIRIPKGIRPGQVIRLSGQGQRGGNLLLEIEYAAHPMFEVDGRNII